MKAYKKVFFTYCREVPRIYYITKLLWPVKNGAQSSIKRKVFSDEHIAVFKFIPTPSINSTSKYVVVYEREAPVKNSNVKVQMQMHAVKISVKFRNDRNESA